MEGLDGQCLLPLDVPAKHGQGGVRLQAAPCTQAHGSQSWSHDGETQELVLRR
jgi:hypothetical protein|eukprot:COSAG01_NODE_7127_length_3338_cov_2.237728_3_plen_53_part_00